MKHFMKKFPYKSVVKMSEESATEFIGALFGRLFELASMEVVMVFETGLLSL